MTPGRRPWRAVGLSLALFALFVLSAVQTASAGPRMPASFFGITTNSQLTDGQVNLKNQLASMRRIGTGSIRFPIYWSVVQPYASFSEVPASERAQFTDVGGIPTDWRSIDTQILAYAKHRLNMLPVILQAPVWGRVNPLLLWSPPADPRRFGAFVGAVVRRYGTHGHFWAAHPGLSRWAPTWWQLWNEPAGGGYPDGPSLFWNGPEPYEPRYLAMVSAGRAAARAADRRAKIVAAGLFGASWKALSRLHSYGDRGLFNAIAIHPYANTAAHVLKILQYVHHTLKRDGQAGLPLLVTETGWTSSAGSSPPGSGYGIETTPAYQAANLAAEYPLLVANRRALNLHGIYWYTWVGPEPSKESFDYSGLLRLTNGKIQTKPAYYAYVRALRKLER